MRLGRVRGGSNPAAHQVGGGGGAGGWVEVLAPIAFTGDYAGWQDNTLRWYIPPNVFSVSGSKFRLRMSGSQWSPARVVRYDKTYFGEQSGSDLWLVKASAPAPIQVTYATAVETGNIPFGSFIQSDDMTFAIDKTKGYVLSVYIGASGDYFSYSSDGLMPGSFLYWHAGDDATGGGAAGYNGLGASWNDGRHFCLNFEIFT